MWYVCSSLAVHVEWQRQLLYCVDPTWNSSTPQFTSPLQLHLQQPTRDYRTKCLILFQHTITLTTATLLSANTKQPLRARCYILPRRF